MPNHKKNRLLILAAGMSSRMKKETTSTIEENLLQQANTLPKCMIGLGRNGRPFLDYLLCNAARGGITEVMLLLNPTDAVTQAYYERQVSDNQVFGLKLLFVRQAIPVGRTKPLGTSDGILQALAQQPDWQNERFVVCNSDNIYPANIFELLNQETTNAMIAFDAQGYDEARVRNCAIVKTDAQNFLVDLVEKPTDNEWAIIKTQQRIGFSWNIFGLNAAEVIPFFENTPLHPIRQEKELPVSIKMMVNTNPQSMKAIWVNEVIPDLTSKADIAEVQQYLEVNFEI